ncbi:MAG: hypothetical protein JSW65_01665 [Candidatus Bipolaricaulota bacterium]|nr:MAG: hypothetical protein JSW65_01665 [Candidatus Bipolaricaulota bacterium]
MKARHIVAWLSLLAVACALPVRAMDNVAALLSLGSSARALGAGGAFSALADGGTGVGSNPAGLAWDEDVTVSSFLARDFGALSYGAISVALPHVGAQLSQIDSGPIATPEGTLRYVARSLVGGGGAAVGPVAAGARAKLYWLVEPGEATGWSIDAAALLSTTWVRGGVVVENAWSQPVRFADGHEEPWMRSLTLAAAVSAEPMADLRWTLLLEGRGIFARSAPRLLAGLEVWFGPVALRAGFDGTSPTFGVGLQFSSYAMDWAYVAHADLGGGHRLSLSFRF